MMSAADAGAEAIGASRVGAELRAARQRLGWTLPQVASQLRIRLPYLEAVEDGRIADLPGNAYAVGFLRSYASMLGLDATEVARRFRAEAQEVNRKTELMFPAPVPERGVPAGAVVLLGAVIAAGAYVGWYKYSGEARTPDVVVPTVPERLAPIADRAVPPSNPSPQVASILPPPSAAPVAGLTQFPQATPPAPAVSAPPPPAAPPAPPSDTSRTAIRAKTDAWVQVRERGGSVLLSRVLRAGETWHVPKGQPVLLTTGNVGGTEILVDDKPLPAMSGTGVKRDIAIDPDAGKLLTGAAGGSTGRATPQ